MGCLSVIQVALLTRHLDIKTEFRGEVQAADGNIEVLGVLTVFEAMRLDEVSEWVRRGGEGFPRLSLKSLQCEEVRRPREVAKEKKMMPERWEGNQGSVMS